VKRAIAAGDVATADGEAMKPSWSPVVATLRTGNSPDPKAAGDGATPARKGRGRTRDSIVDVTAADLVADVRQEAAADAPAETRAKRAVALIRARTGRRWVGIYRVMTGEVRNLAWSGPGAPAYPNFPIDRGLTADAIRCRSTVLSNDVANDPRYLTNQESTGSELIVPVVLDGKVVGTLDIEDARTNAFNNDDEEFFEELAAALSDLYR
jgi:putative methionine-R-sulfoxide reductase with GAF domain